MTVNHEEERKRNVSSRRKEREGIEPEGKEAGWRGKKDVGLTSSRKGLGFLEEGAKGGELLAKKEGWNKTRCVPLRLMTVPVLQRATNGNEKGKVVSVASESGSRSQMKNSREVQ